MALPLWKYAPNFNKMQSFSGWIPKIKLNRDRNSPLGKKYLLNISEQIYTQVQSEKVVQSKGDKSILYNCKD